MTMHSPARFGEHLRMWRKRRGLSQLELAGVAGTSQRHVSFLESGRSAPSPQMVLSIAEALHVPLRQQNALLQAAGFAAKWKESSLAGRSVGDVGQALDLVLNQQEPYPAFVVDRQWNLQRANLGAARLVKFILGSVPEGPVNLADALLAPAVLRPFVVNWQEVALHFIRLVEADAMADGDAQSRQLLTRLLGHEDVAGLLHARIPDEAPQPLLPMHLRKQGVELRLFSTIATLGTPQDITAQEIRIESFFPADEATRRFFREGSADL